jgi:hypothetical protein
MRVIRGNASGLMCSGIQVWGDRFLQGLEEPLEAQRLPHPS